MTISGRIAERASALRLSARSISDRLTGDGHEVSRATVSLWINGGRLPSLDLLVPLAEVLGCDPCWLLVGRRLDAPALADDERRVLEQYRLLRDRRGLGPEEAIDRLYAAPAAAYPLDQPGGADDPPRPTSRRA